VSALAQHLQSGLDSGVVRGADHETLGLALLHRLGSWMGRGRVGA